MLKIVIALLSVALVAGCSSRITDFTVISTKNFDLSRMAEYERSDMRTEGIDTKHIIIFIPTGIPNAKEAIDQAIESVPGAVALLDGVLSVRHFYIPLLYGQSSYVVRGTALIDPQLLSYQGASEENLMIVLDEDGQVSDSKGLSEEELAELWASVSE